MFGEALAGPEWSDASGWAEPEYYSTIRLGSGPGVDLGDTDGPPGETGSPRAGVQHADTACGCGIGARASPADGWPSLIPLAGLLLVVLGRRRSRCPYSAP